MPVEIKQLTIRGEIRNEPEQSQHSALDNADIELLKEELLEECRRMMEELLERQRER